MQLICRVNETSDEESSGDLDALLVEVTPELVKLIKKLSKFCVKENLSEVRKHYADIVLFEPAMPHDCGDISPAEEDRRQKMQDKIEEQFEAGVGWFCLDGVDQIQIPSEWQVDVEDYIVELTVRGQEFFWTIAERKRGGGWESSSIAVRDLKRLAAGLS